MFAVVYQCFVKPGREDAFQDAWHMIASYFIEKRGALGSCLHRAEDGLWVAYSRWPDKETRGASWPVLTGEVPAEIAQAFAILKECIELQLPDLCLTVIDNLL